MSERSTLTDPRPAAARGDRMVRELDGVRGIAILLVLGFHFGARPPGVPRILTAPFSFGWTGVDLFFVLSGFLITGILLDTRKASNYFASFYARRVLRIFPLYLCAVAAYFLVAMPIAHHFGYWQSQTGALQVWYWCHLSNWQSAIGNDVQVLTHFWSLAVEEQFYLVWPLVVYLVPPSRLARVCGVVIVSALALRFAFSGQLHQHPEFLYRLTPFRLDTLAFGGLVATIVRDPSWSARLQRLWPALAAGAAVTLVGVAAVGHSSKPSGPLIATLGYSLAAITYACLVFQAFVHSGSAAWWARVLRNRVLVAFGKYSYAIYILHPPLSGYQNRLLLSVGKGLPAGTQTLLWMASKVIGVAVSLAAAWVSWHMLEKHFLRLKRRFVPEFAPSPPAERSPVVRASRE